MPSTSALPSHSLLRELTDRLVVDQLLRAGQLTRAEIAQLTGVSKPTISEAVRRLTSVGLLTEGGQQTGRRGPAGTFYRLRDDVGVAMSMSAGPDGVVAELLDVRGELLDRIERQVSSPITAELLEPLLLEAATAMARRSAGPVLASALSLAGPVDQRTGRLIHLPDSPFVLDELRPRELLGSLAGDRLRIDNDVNWAAMAERHEGTAQDLADFFFCYLGPGLGGAVVSHGELLRGDRGLAGEIAHVLVRGPGGRAMRLVECFAAWDLVRPGAATIEVERVIEVLDGRTPAQRRLTEGILGAVAGMISSVITLLNPAGVVIGGPWGNRPDLVEQVALRLEAASVAPAVVRVAALGHRAPLLGARLHAVTEAQAALTART